MKFNISVTFERSTFEFSHESLPIGERVFNATRRRQNEFAELILDKHSKSV